MSLSAIVEALIASGCTPEQIGAAVRAHEAEQSRLSAMAEARTAEKLANKRLLGAARQAKYRQKANTDSDESDASPTVTMRDEASVTRHIASNAHADAPAPTHVVSSFNNNITPLPSVGPQVIEPQPIDQKSKRTNGSCLPDDWQPSQKLIDYGVRLGLTDGESRSIMENMRLWARANRNRSVARKSDWDDAMMGALRRDAQKTIRARAGPQISLLSSSVVDPSEADRIWAQRHRANQ